MFVLCLHILYIYIMKKREFTETEINNIIQEYLNGLGTHALGKKYKTAHKRIRSILFEQGVSIRTTSSPYVGDSPCSDISKTKTKIYDSKIDDNTYYIAKCKKTGKSFDDINNLSGALTRHINLIYGDVPIPTNTYQRKKYEIKYGKKWFEEYFDIIETTKKETRSCSLCDWTTEDVDNKTGCFETHVKSNHGITIGDYLDKFPNEIKFHPTYQKKVEYDELLTQDKNYVICRLCNTKMKVITNTHLEDKHGITTHDYKLMYPSNSLLSDTSLEVFSKNSRDINITMKPVWTSKAEIEILDFLTELGIDVDKSRNRSLLNGSELDIVIPSMKIAIEYNGLYWHTESKGKNSTYHLSKTKSCNAIGYSLIHIFEDEWVLKKDLVKGKLKHMLGLSNGIRIGARQCEIRPISNKLKNKFLKESHIQGVDRSNISLGAYYSSVLVGVMTFNSKRNMTKNDEGVFELSRFATHSDYIVIGLASKMLKYFTREYDVNSILSFADRRWTLDPHNNMYTKLGFDLVNIVKPSYAYYNSSVDKYKRFHKFGFGKSALRKKYPDLDFKKTEKELTIELGYDRIWDCGLFKYQLNF